MIDPALSDLRSQLVAVPEPELADDLEPGIADSVHYLGSDAALQNLAKDVYWPKWHSPWWHMMLLHELGETHRIPERAIAAMVDGLRALPVKIFPIHPGDPRGTRPWSDTACHCALGTMSPLLRAAGADVEASLPWIAPWFPRYQMADGGLTCDEAAYLVEHECPSSMVGTIAPFEAMLAAPASADRTEFLDRAAGFLIGRELRLGSATAHNAEERTAAASWPQPCFPRFYHYDTLRGLAVLVRYAEAEHRLLPLDAVASVAAQLAAAFPDGIVRVQRHGYAICPMGWRHTADGGGERVATSFFPLLDAASAIGRPSAALTRQWTAARRRLIGLLDGGRITA